MFKPYRKRMVAVGMIGTAVLMAGCAGPSAPSSGGTSTADAEFDWGSAEAVELTVSSIFSPGSTATNVIEDWMAAVTEATEGKITFDYYPTATLHGATEALSAMDSGLTDITFVSNGYFPDQLPVSNWDDVVTQKAVADFGFPDSNIAGIGQMVIHYDNADNAAAAEMKDAGFIPLIQMVSGPSVLTCSNEYETAADLEGRQVRVANAIAMGENEALGMTGVFTPSNEQFEALQRGVLDCAVNAPTSVTSFGLLEVAPWISLPNYAPVTGANWVMSNAAWDELAPEAQDVLLDARYVPMERFAKDTLDTYSTLVAAAEEAGGGLIDATALSEDVQAWWADQPDSATTAPESVTDAAAQIESTDATAQAWRDFSIETLKVPADVTDILDVLDQGSAVIDEDAWTAWREALAEALGKQ